MTRITQRHRPLQMRLGAKMFNRFGVLDVDWDIAVEKQMMNAMNLPIALGGALMPDAHLGYGVPIGSVVETMNAIIPGAVGMDIGCQVHMSVFECELQLGEVTRERLLRVARECSRFGLGAAYSLPLNHPIMDDPRWDMLDPILKDKAWSQLGTTGGGNHFVDIVLGERSTDLMMPGLPQSFTAILTHSGSRNVGKQVAEYFMKKAIAQTDLPDIDKELCWLTTGSEDGIRYIQAMQLMSDYAYACHELIHDRFIKGINSSQIFHRHSIHNLAWLDETEPKAVRVLHRKGAVQADRHQAVLIPGSSGSNSYLCSGLGNVNSFNSSAHGAGRFYSRNVAKRNHNEEKYQAHMTEHNIASYGIAKDETVFAYKDIERVMKQQRLLVTPVATLKPIVVVMGGKSDDGD